MTYKSLRPYPLALDEEARLTALAEYGLTDTLPDAQFDHIVRLASKLFQVPVALVSLVERNRQFFKARVGLNVCETSRDVSFCAHAISDDKVLVVPDATKDPRFSDNELVLGAPYIRFYAGAPLVGASGHKLGSLCLIDMVPRARLTEDEEKLLVDLAVLVVDRMEVRRQEKMRLAGQRRFENMTATSPSAIVCADASGYITAWNGSATSIFGYTSEEVLGFPLDIIIPERLREAHAGGMRSLSAGGSPRMAGRAVELVAQRRNGEEFPVELSLSFWQEAAGFAFGAILTDITARRQSEERLRHLAHHDQLTGLPNRTRFLEMAGTSKVAEGSAILLFDLDRFQDVNDSLGHSVGDKLLRSVARRLIGELGPEPIAARLGGDEFGILLPGCTDPLKVAAVADTIIALFSAPFEVDGHSLHISTSIGVAFTSVGDTGVDEIIANADLALYRAKAEGGGCYQFFMPALRNVVATRRSLEIELRRAFTEHEFELHFQPQIRLSDGAFVGAEALIRWRHPDRGLLAPAAFLPVLEVSPLAVPVGRWIITTACAQAADWRRAGLPDIRMGVNLFAAQFRSGDLVSTVVEALRVSGLPPQNLELEITENTILKYEEAMIILLRELRALGVSIAFDDYGTGYASLSLLKRYPLSRLKIDRSFIRDLVSDPDDEAIVKAVLALGRSLVLEVIAEGIETVEQEAFLKLQSCAEGQGYLYGKPMEGLAFEKVLRPRLAAA